MQHLLRAPRAPLSFSLVAVIGLSLFVLAVGVLSGPASAVVGMERLSELVCLQLAFVPERAIAVLLNFPPQARLAIAELLVPGDLVMAWGYGLTMMGLLGLLVMRLPGKWFQYGAILMWAPVVASIMDCTEDVFLYAIVGQVIVDESAEIAPVLTLLAGIAASLKYFALSVVSPVFGFAGIVKGITIDRSLSAWVVYLLLAMVLLSMLSKPLQDIPPCF